MRKSTILENILEIHRNSYLLILFFKKIQPGIAVLI